MVVGNVRLDGVTVKVEPAACPVPLTVTLWGEPVALSVTWIEPDSAPAAVGLNATVKLQLAPTARVEPQPLVGIRNDEAFVPAGTIEVMLTTVVPVFVRVAV